MVKYGKEVCMLLYTSPKFSIIGALTPPFPSSSISNYQIQQFLFKQFSNLSISFHPYCQYHSSLSHWIISNTIFYYRFLFFLYQLSSTPVLVMPAMKYCLVQLTLQQNFSVKETVCKLTFFNKLLPHQNHLLMMLDQHFK